MGKIVNFDDTKMSRRIIREKKLKKFSDVKWQWGPIFLQEAEASITHFWWADGPFEQKEESTGREYLKSKIMPLARYLLSCVCSS